MNGSLTASCCAVLDLAASQISFQELIAYTLMYSLNNNVNGLQALNFELYATCYLGCNLCRCTNNFKLPAPAYSPQGGCGVGKILYNPRDICATLRYSSKGLNDLFQPTAASTASKVDLYLMSEETGDNLLDYWKGKSSHIWPV